jgi:signal transduction histidine kinase
MAEPEKKETGRVIYSRPGTGEDEKGAPGERDEKPDGGAGPSALSPEGAQRPSLVPTLLPLLIGFALLLALVIGLGGLSVRQLQTISTRTLEEERRYNDTINVLLKLRNALYNLDNEARVRGRVEAGTAGVLLPPMELRLKNARAEVQQLVPSYERLPISRTEKGTAFRRDLNAYLEVTADSGRYNLEGFELFHRVEPELGALLDEASSRREAITEQRDDSLERARRQINFLKWLAALTGLVVAAGTIWEVQRRFRQLRSSFLEVRRERQFSAQMIEGMVSAIAAVDRAERVRGANAAFFELFPEAEAGAPLYENITSPEGTRMLRAALSPGVEHATYHGRWRLPVDESRAGGDGASSRHERAFDVYSSPLEIDGERGRLLTLVDVTEAAEAEGELRRQESLAAVGQAAAQVAHEIKNPLGSIRLGVAMLRNITKDKEAITTIDLVERGIDHLSKLTLDVTQFSRRRQLSLSDTELHELLDESLDLVSSKVREKRTPVEKHYSGEPLRAQWDEDQLRQVFVNLIANAIDAGAEASPVEISTSRVMAATNVKQNGGRAGREVPCARVEIADHGAGMDEATRARIFEPFFTTKKRGTGLGLAIAKQIIEQHGGVVRVASTPGEGTRFTIDLPLSAEGQ